MTHDLRIIDELLRETAARADCTRRRVGAVIVRDSGLVVGVGWNGLPDGSCQAGACPRGQKSYEEVPASSDYAGNCAALHAERQAIARAGRWVADSTLYVTDEPCPWCAKACEEAGLAVVVRLQS